MIRMFTVVHKLFNQPIMSSGVDLRFASEYAYFTYEFDLSSGVDLRFASEYAYFTYEFDLSSVVDLRFASE